MKRALSSPKIFGIQVYIHWTFSLLIIWIVFTNLRAGMDLVHVGWMILFVLSLFLCVTLHELGHALAARRYGIQTKDITLYPIGGVASLERMPEKPIQELVVALAGPAVNVVIMLLLLPLMLRSDIFSDSGEKMLVIHAGNFLPMLGIINVWLALFNLIPAFPMDGGRVLRALLSMKTNRVRATNIAAMIGKGLAVLFVIGGFYLNPFLIFIGIFVFMGAHAESRMVSSQSFISGMTARDAVMTRYQTLDLNRPLADAIKLLLDGEAKNFLITDNGRPYGVINRDLIIKGISSGGESLPVKDVADTNLIYCKPDVPLFDVFLEFQKTRTPIILVFDDLQLIGIIDAENIAELMMVNQAKMLMSK